MDIRLLTSNVVPQTLRRIDRLGKAFALSDLVRLSGGHDFLLQASNAMCAQRAFASLQLRWIVGRFDAPAIAALRNSEAAFESAALQRLVAAAAGTGGLSLLLRFAPHDVVFDAADQCRIRLGVTVAVGTQFVMPDEPPLVRTPRLGETVQGIDVVRVNDPLIRVGQALAAAAASLANEPPVLRTLSKSWPVLDNRFATEIVRDVSVGQVSQRIDLGDRSFFDVSAWLGGGLLEIAAPFAATAVQASQTIQVAADVQQSIAVFTGFSADAMLLLSADDPLGIVAATTNRVRQRRAVSLVDEVSLVGAPANASAGHLGPLAADCYPCRLGAGPLNVTANLTDGQIGARGTVDFIGPARHGVIWSTEGVRRLIRYCWETGAFPRGIVQTQIDGVRLRIDGVEQNADAISVFTLDTLDVIGLDYDANGRRDVLLTRGMARVVPKLLRLKDGRELVPKDLNDEVFTPSAPAPWAALGELTEEPLSAGSPELLVFLRAITRGVTSRLGRPFTDPPATLVVTESHLSAPAQRVALLVS